VLVGVAAQYVPDYVAPKREGRVVIDQVRAAEKFPVAAIAVAYRKIIDGHGAANPRGSEPDYNQRRASSHGQFCSLCSVADIYFGSAGTIEVTTAFPSRVKGFRMNFFSAERPVVLIVEDDFLIRMHAAEMIADAGFDVVEAASADQAILILEARLDNTVVFTDI
jgi:hypothetical protein